MKKYWMTVVLATLGWRWKVNAWPWSVEVVSFPYWPTLSSSSSSVVQDKVGEKNIPRRLGTNKARGFGKTKFLMASHQGKGYRMTTMSFCKGKGSTSTEHIMFMSSYKGKDRYISKSFKGKEGEGLNKSKDKKLRTTSTPTFTSDLSVPSPAPTLAPTGCLLGICDAVDFAIAWTTSQQDVTQEAGGWRLSNNGRAIRFAIEDSSNCNGTNDAVQSGQALATITVPEEYLLTLDIEGISELEDEDFELMDVFLDDELVVSATSNGLGLGCEMGPSNVTFFRQVPFVLATGNHTFAIDFTTADNLFHVDAYYELQLAFQPAAS